MTQKGYLWWKLDNEGRIVIHKDNNDIGANNDNEARARSMWTFKGIVCYTYSKENSDCIIIRQYDHVILQTGKIFRWISRRMDGQTDNS